MALAAFALVALAALAGLKGLVATFVALDTLAISIILSGDDTLFALYLLYKRGIII